MRPSEASGLRWGDFDPPRATITVSRSRYLNADGMTKTRGSYRSIKLLPHVAELLQQRMPLHADAGQFIFTNLEGGPIDQGEWARYYWQRALRAVGVRLRKFYATRHTFISLALTHGVNPKWVAERCGTSLAMIEKHYGRFMPGSEDAQLALLAATVTAVAAADRAKPRPARRRVAVSAQITMQKKVVPTGIEPVLPT
jgi:integrase